MIEEKLEILLITYNRYKDLDNTLKQFLGSPFCECKITILDNCSTDKTPVVCDKYQKLFPKISVIRHKMNIGGNANFLRAVETARSTYTWILGDDDYYNFSGCSDIIKAIESENFDIISVGFLGNSEGKRGIETTSNELINMGVTYFHSLSFISGSIYKTDLYNSYCVNRGYDNITNLFPHFVFINRSYEKNFSVYVSKETIVTRGDHNTTSFAGLEWLNGWLNSCYMIKDKKIEKKAVYEVATGFSSFTLMILYLIALDKSRSDNEFQKNIIHLISAIILTFGVKTIFLLILIIPTALLPSFLCEKVIKNYLTHKYGQKTYEQKKYIERTRR